MSRRILAISGAVAALAAVFVLGRASSDLRHRKPVDPIGFRPAIIDLGRQPWHSTAGFMAEFVNGGPTPVTIAGLHASCGCTGINPANYVEKTVAPGESIEISGTLDIGNRLGKRTSEVELLLADGTVYFLQITYDGYPTYTFRPARLTFSGVQLDGDQAPFGTILFSSPSVDVLSVESDDTWLRTTRRKRGSGETEIVITLSLEDLKHGKQFGKVTVLTDDPYRPRFVIPVMAEGTAALRPVPAYLLLSLGRRGRVRFVQADGTYVSAMLCEPIPDGIHAEPAGDEASALMVSYTGIAPPEDPITVHVVTDSGLRTRFFVQVMVPNKPTHSRRGQCDAQYTSRSRQLRNFVRGTRYTNVYSSQPVGIRQSQVWPGRGHTMPWLFPQQSWAMRMHCSRSGLQLLDERVSGDL